MARVKSGEPSRSRAKPSAIEELTRGIAKLQELSSQIDDLTRDGFPYREAVLARTELSLRETIRRLFGEKSSEYQTHKQHKLRIGTRAESGLSTGLVKELIVALENQKAGLLGMKPDMPAASPSPSNEESMLAASPLRPSSDPMPAPDAKSTSSVAVAAMAVGPVTTSHKPPMPAILPQALTVPVETPSLPVFSAPPASAAPSPISMESLSKGPSVTSNVSTLLTSSLPESIRSVPQPANCLGTVPTLPTVVIYPTPSEDIPANYTPHPAVTNASIEKPEDQGNPVVPEVRIERLPADSPVPAPSSMQELPLPAAMESSTVLSASGAPDTVSGLSAAEPSATPASTLSERTEDETLNMLRRICARFHLVARQLRLRKEYRPTLEINDEYDLQDLFYALLRLQFDEVGTDEWIPDYANGAQRTTYFLDWDRTAIVVKQTRPGWSAKDFAEQIKSDAARYSARQNGNALLCFIYDPEGRVGNPRGLEADLTTVRDQYAVQVIVAPK
ncbi:MAG: hypothetical protein K0S45_3009 [Nitrospira sp.]|jgi:hypothetical protein|nr:hypothetical protein [Nitrospira sp.]